MAKITNTTARWRTWGGWGLIIAAGLDLIVLGLGLVTGESWLFWLSTVISLVSGLVMFLALWVLAFGKTGSNGIIGNSVLGKVAIVGFGVLWVLQRIVNLGYSLLPDSAGWGVYYTSLAVSVLGLVFALAAAVLIYRKKVAHGVARWSLFVAIVIGGVASLVPFGVSAVAVAVAALAVLSQAFVGLTYLFNGAPKAADVE